VRGTYGGVSAWSRCVVGGGDVLGAERRSTCVGGGVASSTLRPAGTKGRRQPACSCSTLSCARCGVSCALVFARCGAGRARPRGGIDGLEIVTRPIGSLARSVDARWPGRRQETFRGGPSAALAGRNAQGLKPGGGADGQCDVRWGGLKDVNGDIIGVNRTSQR
jgi:hypothetical protein